MILDAIIRFLLAILNGVLGLFPAWSLPFSPEDVGGGIALGVLTANAFFPVSTLGACLGAILALRVVMFGWAICVWAYDKLPFKAS